MSDPPCPEGTRYIRAKIISIYKDETPLTPMEEKDIEALVNQIIDEEVKLGACMEDISVVPFGDEAVLYTIAFWLPPTSEGANKLVT